MIASIVEASGKKGKKKKKGKKNKRRNNPPPSIFHDGSHGTEHEALAPSVSRTSDLPFPNPSLGTGSVSSLSTLELES